MARRRQLASTALVRRVLLGTSCRRRADSAGMEPLAGPLALWTVMAGNGRGRDVTYGGIFDQAQREVDVPTAAR